MNWERFWTRKAEESSDPNAQVGRTNRRLTSEVELTDRILSHIVSKLELSRGDDLLDVCCGNGVLTARLSGKCRAVTGADLSKGQIRLAKADHGASNITYIVADATQLSQNLNGGFDKINLYFSFQYLDTFAKGRKAIDEMLSLLKSGGKIFIGDVPDRNKIRQFYGSSWKVFRYYHLGNLSGRNDMGKFWSEDEIARICGEFGVDYQWMDQPEDLPYARYRSDIVIS